MSIADSRKGSSLLKVGDVAEYLRVHPSTIYRLLRRKKLPAFKLGGDWRFDLESIDRWRLDCERPKDSRPSNRSQL
jgi:excisionase family DNA binding protein